jgi:hypothetical protein
MDLTQPGNPRTMEPTTPVRAGAPLPPANRDDHR